MDPKKKFDCAFVVFYLAISIISLWKFGYLSPDEPELINGSSFPKPCTEISNFDNFYYRGFAFDFNAFLSEKEEFDHKRHLIWSMPNLTYYGNDPLIFRLNQNISASKVS